MTLSTEQKERYAADGFLVFPRLFGPEDMGHCLQRLRELVLEERLRPAGVRMQVEPVVQRGAASAASPLDALRKVEELVAHDDVFLALAKDPRLLGPVTDLLGPDIKLFRDALMMK